MSSNRGQHVVPEFYLTLFADVVGKVWGLRKSDGGTFHTSPHNIAKERDAFSISNQGVRDNQFDAVNNRIESFVAPHLKRLKENIFDQDVINAVGALSANLITRSRCIRDQLSVPSREVADFLKRIPDHFINKVREDEALAMFGFGSWDPTAAAQSIERASEIAYPISQVFVTDVAEWLANRRCILIKAPPSAEFITSDDPVVIMKAGELHDLDGGVVSLLKTQDVDVLIPLLPTIACVWKSGAPAATLDVVATEEYCHHINLMITKSAYQQVYSSAKERLSLLAHDGNQPEFIPS